MEFAGRVAAARRAGDAVGGGRRGHGHRRRRGLRRAARDPRAPGRARPRRRGPGRRRRHPRGLHHGVGRPRRPGRAHRRAGGPGPRRRLGGGHGRHPGRRRPAGPGARHLLGRQAGRLRGARRRAGRRLPQRGLRRRGQGGHRGGRASTSCSTWWAATTWPATSTRSGSGGRIVQVGVMGGADGHVPARRPAAQAGHARRHRAAGPPDRGEDRPHPALRPRGPAPVRHRRAPARDRRPLAAGRGRPRPTAGMEANATVGKMLLDVGQ